MFRKKRDDLGRGRFDMHLPLFTEVTCLGIVKKATMGIGECSFASAFRAMEHNTVKGGLSLPENKY